MLQRKLGRYELLRVLGKGAMGVVYEGLDPNLDRRVAIKTIIVDDLGPDAAAEYEARFQVEARSAARLQHPNIVTVYDSARDGGTAFLVMEFIEGDDLKQHLDRGQRYDTAQALRLIVDLLSALDYAHRQGVVHRDVKPANLLIEPGGRLKLTDFGVARIAGEATRTQGSMIGTLKYMAPEQVQGQKSDGRADLFSAAVVAYHLLTGVRPFDGDNDFTIIHQIIGHSPAAPSTLKPGLPVALDAVFERALAKSRDDRFQTGADFSTALRRSLQGVVTEGPDAPTMPGTVPGLPRRGDTLPGATKDHELELEYWRAVRDSVDAGELQDFLGRFPQGLYADLARRRLDRLTGGSDPDRTVLQGMTNPSPARPRTEPTATLPLSREDQEGTPASAPAAAAAPSARPIPPRKEDTTVRPLPQPRRRAPVWLAAAVAAVAVGGGALWWATRAPVQSPGAPALAAATPAPAASPGAPSPATPAPAAAIPAATPAVAQASASTRVASAPAPAVKPRVATAAPARQRPSPAQSARQDGQETTARAGGLVPPAVTCRDKVFLARQFCVYNECQKPGYQNFPACVQLREEAKLREGSGKYGN